MLGQSLGKCWQGGVEEAGDTFQHRLWKGWKWVSTTKLLEKRVNMIASGAGLISAVPCSPPHLDGGQGQVLERQPGARGQELVPASQTNGQDQGRDCHPAGDTEAARCPAGEREGGAAPLGAVEGRTENRRPAASAQRMAGDEASLRVASPCVWPPCPLVAAGQSWWPWAGVGRRHAGAEPGMGRDGGAGFHKVPWQVHFIPPRASSLGVRHPSPNSADAALCPHQTSCGSPQICLCSQRSLQHHPTPSPSWGTACAWCFFGISYLRHGQAKHFRRRSRAACAWGPMGNPGNITKAAKKTQNTQLAGKYKQGLMEAFAEDMASPSAAKSLGSGGTFPSSLPQFPPASPREQQSWGCHVYCVTLDTWGRCREPGRCFPIPFSFLCASEWLIVVCYDLFVLSLQPQVKHLEGRRTRP